MLKRYIVKRYFDPARVPFYVEDASGQVNTLSIVMNNQSAPVITIEYSTDNTTWQTLGNTSTTALTYNIPANGRVYLRANATNWNVLTNSYHTFSATGSHIIGGNLLSLQYYDDFFGKTAFKDNGTMGLLFMNDVNLLRADELILPVTSVPEYGLSSFFLRCNNLESMPDISGIQTVGRYGISNFMSNTKVTSVDISGITDVSAYRALYGFAYGTSTLNDVKVGATNWNSSATEYWLVGVAATGTFTKPANTSIPSWDIPTGWTVVNQ